MGSFGKWCEIYLSLAPHEGKEGQSRRQIEAVTESATDGDIVMKQQITLKFFGDWNEFGNGRRKSCT